MNKLKLNQLRFDLSLKSKNGIDFIGASIIIWSMAAFFWSLNISSFSKSVLTFICGSLQLPLALLLSKTFKTDWKMQDNLLFPFRLWLNVAQLIYLPFLLFTLIQDPDYFILAFAVATGVHLFPYAWLYNEKSYFLVSIIISLGGLIIGLNLPIEKMFFLPLSIAFTLFLFAGWLVFFCSQKILLIQSLKNLMLINKNLGKSDG